MTEVEKDWILSLPLDKKIMFMEESSVIDWLKQKLWQRGSIEKKDFELFNEAKKKLIDISNKRTKTNQNEKINKPKQR